MAHGAALRLGRQHCRAPSGVRRGSRGRPEKLHGGSGARRARAAAVAGQCARLRLRRRHDGESAFAAERIAFKHYVFSKAKKFRAAFKDAGRPRRFAARKASFLPPLPGVLLFGFTEKLMTKRWRCRRRKGSSGPAQRREPEAGPTRDARRVVFSTPLSVFAAPCAALLMTTIPMLLPHYRPEPEN